MINHFFFYLKLLSSSLGISSSSSSNDSSLFLVTCIFPFVLSSSRSFLKSHLSSTDYLRYVGNSTSPATIRLK